MAGFFSKKQYTAIAERAFAIKLLNERCLECSINARLRNKILSATVINEFFHIIFHFGKQLNTIQEQFFKQCLTDISFVGTKLSFDILQEIPLFQWFPVIHVCRSEHEIQDFSLVIDY